MSASDRPILGMRNPRIGLALSGGSVRGLAHIGVIKTLNELGIQPSVIAGTSAGKPDRRGIGGWAGLAGYGADGEFGLLAQPVSRAMPREILCH